MPAGRRQSFRIFPGEGAEFTDGGVFFQDDFALAIREDLEGIALLDPEGAADCGWDDVAAEVVDCATECGRWQLKIPPASYILSIIYDVWVVCEKM